MKTFLNEFHFIICRNTNVYRLGVGSLLDVMHEQDLDDGDDSENAANDNEDYDKKSDTAEDFSDINELAEDLQTAMQVCV